jgi:hypothetical protein
MYVVFSFLSPASLLRNSLQDHSACYQLKFIFFFSMALQSNLGLSRPLLRFLDHTQLGTHTHTIRHTHTHGRFPLCECSATHTPHNKQKILKSMSSAGFKPAVPATERFQTHTIERTAIGIGFDSIC